MAYIEREIMNHKAVILAATLMPSLLWAVFAKIPDKATLYVRIVNIGLQDLAEFDNFILLRRLTQHKLTTKQVIMAVETVIYDFTLYMKNKERALYLQNQNTKVLLLKTILEDSVVSLEHLAMYGYRQDASEAVSNVEINSNEEDYSNA